MVFLVYLIIVSVLMFGERLKLFIPALIWAAIIFIVSSIPNLKTPAFDFRASDKLAHFLEYFILGVFLAYALNKMKLGKWRIFWISACIAGIYGIFDEIHQLLVPGRLMDKWDMLADITGAFAASAIFILKFWKRR